MKSMKKSILIIGVAVAIILCILAAGCTGTTTQTTDQQQTPVSNTYPESDYYGNWEANSSDMSIQVIITKGNIWSSCFVSVPSGKILSMVLGKWGYGTLENGKSFIRMVYNDESLNEEGYYTGIVMDNKDEMYLFTDKSDSDKYIILNKVSDFTYKADVSKSDNTTTTTSKTTTTTTKSTATLGEQNALKSAQSYLRSSSFSYNGLIEQLKYEKYTLAEAKYAADNCGADWNEQALKSAKSYLSHTAFSYNGLIEQLESEYGEGFTHAQAKYAADNCGADWNEQAKKCAASYMKFSSFSKQELIEQLEFEGFTRAQAVAGAASVGYT